jgi:hypothetical protein
MKAASLVFAGLFVLVQLAAGVPAESRAAIACGQSITQDTTLDQDLECPAGTEYALILEAPGITLDLGGHTLSGHAPDTGVLAVRQEGVAIRNGAIEGFRVGVFVIESDRATLENLVVRNLESSDPNQLILGLQILGSQDVAVRDSQFEFLSVAHKEAVEIYESYVDVDNIELRGGGAGVNFSFAEQCDPLNSPSNGTVRNSRFSDVYIAGIEAACSSYALIEGNDFSASPAVGIGIQGDAPFEGAVTNLIVQDNTIHGAMIGVEFRGILDSHVSNNAIFDNQIWGIAIRQSLGCIAPESGWDCFYSTGNTIAGNENWGNGLDLYQAAESSGNTCETKDGPEIPECTPPHAALTIDYASGKPGSFFTLSGANYPANSAAAITINGAALGSVPVDASGELLFLLDTSQADEGEYVVTASVNPSAAEKFVLDSSKLLRPQAGQGTIFNVPGGLVPHYLYLPHVFR